MSIALWLGLFPFVMAAPPAVKDSRHFQCTLTGTTTPSRPGAKQLEFTLRTPGNRNKVLVEEGDRSITLRMFVFRDGNIQARVINPQSGSTWAEGSGRSDFEKPFHMAFRGSGSFELDCR